jgi:hypothetical protein
MELAGLTVPDAEVLLLARKLTAAGRLATADTLADAYACGTKVVALTCAERDDILAILEHPPAPLCLLHAVLLEEHLWRQAVGL